ncbi:Histone deacetylation protein Rxt3 [Artemisia annua]|uniref:Histone deacetylation protein Rxt3 n=1 Tax=Artemisia annua TaxID=35608 RepID=A0A2U1LF60_ARTAN|nr:Histone deacetylation protein Rxt3 [Artemisia annua]
MSGTPNKRVHDDSGGHPSLSRYTHTTQDDSGAYSGMGPANSKLPNPSAPSEYHAPSFDMGQDSRMPKVPRTEIREMDSRRSPMIPMYRMQPSSVNEPQSDHAVNPEESNVRDLKVDNRDVKADTREVYQGVKYDKDFRYTHDYKGEYKHEPSAMYPVNNSRSLNWNEAKDHHRTWKYPDTSGGNMDSRDVSRSNVGDSVTKEDKDHNVPHETASENKVNDDRLKERDRKRKDVKHREWGENNKETKDPSKEERETDRKELPKEKDKVRDKNEKEGMQNDKEDMDVSSSRVVEQKSSENWKEPDKESKDRKMERDGDNEGEKRNKGFDKDSDDGGVDVEGSADRERDGFNYGVQQRKRMLRPRGSPQVGNRDPRFRSRPQDNDGSTGKDVSTVVYRVGECVQELLKLWKEYESAASDKLPESSNAGPTLEIRIPAEHVCATNRQVKGGQLWGTDVYTDDSDLVAVLMHTGFCRPTASPPPSAIQELRATVRVLPPQNCYISTLRNNVRSRAWGAAIGCSFRVERCHIVKKGGGTIDLEPCLTHTSTVEPTLAPVVVERTMTTRAAASNALRQQRFVREVTLQYNLCNEPWIKYSISAIADKGLKKPLFTSARLKKGEVLYLESRTRRFELCFNGEKIVKAGNEAETHLGNGERSMDIDNNNNSNNVTDVFRWSQCKKPLPQTLMLSIGIPLPPEHLEVLEENLDWEDIQWSQTGVWISGKEYPLSRVHFLSR